MMCSQPIPVTPLIDTEMERSNPIYPFPSPATVMCSGATQSGKTTFVMKLLSNASVMFSAAPSKIIYCYSEFQPAFEQALRSIPNLVLHEGLPHRSDILEWTHPDTHTVMVLDDMMKQISKSEDALHLITVTSHHRNCSVIYITQNLFEKGTHSRSISLNVHIFILMTNNRDKRQLATFGSQVFPGEVKFFMDAYEKAIRRTSIGGYLVCDLSPFTEKKYRLRTSIFPSDDVTIVYAPKQ